MTRILGSVRHLVPVPRRNDLADRLVAHSAGAAMLVVPFGLPEIQRVVDSAYCPVVSVPDRSAPAPDAPVVVGCPPWDCDDILAAAFRVATEDGCPMEVVVAADTTGSWMHPLRWWQDAAVGATEAGRSGHDAVAARAMAHPRVPVDVHPVRRDPAEALEQSAQGARLVVLGRSTRGRLLSTVSGSPVDALVRWAACPVMVVPPAGPPHPTWLPHDRDVPTPAGPGEEF